MGYSPKLKKIDKISNENFKKSLNIYDIPLKFKNPFNVKNKEKEKIY